MERIIQIRDSEIIGFTKEDQSFGKSDWFMFVFRERLGVANQLTF